MLRTVVFLCLGFFLLGFRYRTAEQYYGLYHQHLYSYPADIVTGVGYLLAARSAPFNNALYALTPIADETQWRYYQQLFRVHVTLKLVEQQLLLGSKVDKYNVYFFNRAWSKQILASVQQAEQAYQTAAVFWQEALGWVGEMEQRPSYQLPWLARVANWQDEVWQVQTGRIDYHRIIERQLHRIQAVRKFLQLNTDSSSG